MIYHITIILGTLIFFGWVISKAKKPICSGLNADYWYRTCENIGGVLKQTGWFLTDRFGNVVPFRQDGNYYLWTQDKNGFKVKDLKLNIGAAPGTVIINTGWIDD